MGPIHPALARREIRSHSVCFSGAAISRFGGAGVVRGRTSGRCALAFPKYFAARLATFSCCELRELCLIKFRGIVRVPSLPLRVLTRVTHSLNAWARDHEFFIGCYEVNETDM